jgi:CitB-like protein
MQPLLDLVAQARAAAEGEVARELQICNACRYCEGFCAVFPAMARRLEFNAADVHYLANLCHNCGACLHACQYAPPHEFAVSLPQAMARVRRHTYQAYAWPAAFGAAYERNALVLSLALVAGLALFLLLAASASGGLSVPPGGSFYDLFPHGLMVGLFAPVFAFVVLALGIGVARFWRNGAPGSVAGPAAAEAVHDALTLRYLDGGHGEGCHNDDDAWTHARRHAHHAVFYGFLLCFASTSVATLYHYGFGWVAPYGWTSLPKLLGTVGGCCSRWAVPACGGCGARGTRSMWTRAPPAWTWVSSRCSSRWPPAGWRWPWRAARPPCRCCCACTWVPCWRCSSRCPTASSRRLAAPGPAGAPQQVLEEDAHVGHRLLAHQALVHVGVEGELLHVAVLADADEALAPLVAAVPEVLHDAQHPEDAAVFAHEALARQLQVGRVAAGQEGGGGSAASGRPAWRSRCLRPTPAPPRRRRRRPAPRRGRRPSAAAASAEWARLRGAALEPFRPAASRRRPTAARSEKPLSALPVPTLMVWPCGKTQP